MRRKIQFGSHFVGAAGRNARRQVGKGVGQRAFRLLAGAFKTPSATARKPPGNRTSK